MDDLNILGMDRMVRRAFESATAENKDGVAKWHKAELEVARRANAEKAEQFGSLERRVRRAGDGVLQRQAEVQNHGARP